MPRTREHEFDPAKDVVFDSYLLSERWVIHPKRAVIRARQLKIPEVRFNSRSIGWRLSDILAAEEKLLVAEPPREITAA